MSVMPIKWHEQCLHNMESYSMDQQKRLESFKRDIERTEAHINFLKLQLTEAKRQGKDGFDAEKFLVKLRANSQKTSET